MNHTEPYRDCQRFDTCSANDCPLSPISYPSHPKDKSVRSRISASYPGLLPMQGLTRAEWGAKLAYDRKPPSVKAAMIERAKMTIQAVNQTKRGL